MHIYLCNECVVIQAAYHIVVMQELHELSCELFTLALYDYSDSTGWPPKAWTPKLSESHLCTHPPPNHSPVGITSSLQLQIRSAHCAHFA